MKTIVPSANRARTWHLLDAAGAPLGRIAAEAARLLGGKHLPEFTPHLDLGDGVIIINADKVVMTGANKAAQKMYRYHTRFSGGFREVSAQRMQEKNPEKILENAISGMLPKNRLRPGMLTRLRVFTGADHPLAAQKPVPFSPTWRVHSL